MALICKMLFFDFYFFLLNCMHVYASIDMQNDLTKRSTTTTGFAIGWEYVENVIFNPKG